MDHTLATAFLALPSETRQAELRNLIHRLQPEDCSFIHNVLVEQHDPLARLPLDILLRIFDFLHPFYIWSLRTVCKRWNALLSSGRVMGTQFARFDSQDQADSGLHMISKFEWEYQGIMRNRLRHVQALRLGRPFSYAEIKDDLAVTLDHCAKGSALQEYSLCGTKIAYLRGKKTESRTVVLRNVVTGKAISFYGAAREQIKALALSHQILAYANRSGQVYITDLMDSTRTRYIRLPSSNIQAMVADRSVVAMLLVGVHDTNQATIVLYDHSTSSTTSFGFTYQADDHPHNSSIPPQTLLLNTRGNVIDIFGAALALGVGSGGHDHESTQFRIGHMRLSLAGAVMCSSIETWWQNLYEDNLTAESNPDELPSAMLGALSSMGRSGLFLLPGETKMDRDGWDRRWSRVFDTVHARFYSADILSNYRCPGYGGSHRVIWKGCMYMAGETSTLETIRVYLADMMGNVCLPRVNDDREWEDDLSTSTTALMVNDSFIVQITPMDKSVLVLCFDEDVYIAGAKPTGLWEDRASYGDRSFVDDFGPDGVREQHIAKSMPFYTGRLGRRATFPVRSPPARYDDLDEWAFNFGESF